MTINTTYVENQCNLDVLDDVLCPLCGDYDDEDDDALTLICLMTYFTDDDNVILICLMVYSIL